MQRVNLQKKRTRLTRVGLICDRPDAQPVLPQVFIGNEATFPEREMGGLCADCPPNVILIRQKRAWNNAGVLRRILRLLASALRERRKAHWRPPMLRLQPVRILDVSLAHIQLSVARSCYALGIWAIAPPARLTWLLQPLDTRAFQTYKQYFGAACQRARLQTADGTLSVAQFLEAFFDAIRRVLQGHLMRHQWRDTA